MQAICEAVSSLLQGAGIRTQAAYPAVAARRIREPLATVEMKRWALAGRPVYLGLMEQLEVYGHRMEGGLEIAAHAPTAREAVALAQEITAVLLGGIEGLSLRQLETGAAAYARELDTFVCPVQAAVEAWLYAVPREDGLYFEDFVLRGRLEAAQREQEENT